jgi:hypothetical protein
MKKNRIRILAGDRVSRDDAYDHQGADSISATGPTPRRSCPGRSSAAARRRYSSTPDVLGAAETAKMIDFRAIPN